VKVCDGEKRKALRENITLEWYHFGKKEFKRNIKIRNPNCGKNAKDFISPTV
jgi:hypothetical protein